jgi:hypothetical protein
VLGGTALAVAALSGSVEAFGLTLGVLAAAQATWGGLRVERGLERIDQVASRIERADRLERLARVEQSLDSIRTADLFDTLGKPGALDVLDAQLDGALRACDTLPLPRTREVPKVLVLCFDLPSDQRGSLRDALGWAQQELEEARGERSLG